MVKKLLTLGLFGGLSSVLLMGQVFGSVELGSGFTGCYGTGENNVGINGWGDEHWSAINENNILAFAPLMSVQNMGNGEAFKVINEVTLCDGKRIDLSSNFEECPSTLYYCTKGGPNIPLCDIAYTSPASWSYHTSAADTDTKAVNSIQDFGVSSPNPTTIKNYCCNRDMIREFANFLKRAKKYLSVVDLSTSPYYTEPTGEGYYYFDYGAGTGTAYPDATMSDGTAANSLNGIGKSYSTAASMNYSTLSTVLPNYLIGSGKLFDNSTTGVLKINRCNMEAGVLPPIVLTQDWRSSCFLNLPTLTMCDGTSLNLSDDHRYVYAAGIATDLKAVPDPTTVSGAGADPTTYFPCGFDSTINQDLIESDTTTAAAVFSGTGGVKYLYGTRDFRKILYWCCPPEDVSNSNDVSHFEIEKLKCIAKFSKFLRLSEPENTCGDPCNGKPIDWYGWWGAVDSTDPTTHILYRPVAVTGGSTAKHPALPPLSTTYTGLTTYDVESTTTNQGFWGQICTTNGNDGNEVVLDADWNGLSKCGHHYVKFGDGTTVDMSKFTGSLYWLLDFKKIALTLGLMPPTTGFYPTGFYGKDFIGMEDQGTNRFLAITNGANVASKTLGNPANGRVTLFTSLEDGIWNRGGNSYESPLDIDTLKGTVDVWSEGSNIYTLTLNNPSSVSNNKMIKVNWMEVPPISNTTPSTRDEQLITRFDEGTIDFALIRKYGESIYSILSKNDACICIRKMIDNGASLVKQSNFKLSSNRPSVKVTAADFDNYGNLIIGYVNNGRVRFSKVTPFGQVSDHATGINNVTEITDMKYDKSMQYNSVIFYTTYNNNGGCVAKVGTSTPSPFLMGKKNQSLIKKKDLCGDELGGDEACNPSDPCNNGPRPNEEFAGGCSGDNGDTCLDPCDDDPCQTTNQPISNAIVSNCNFKKPTSLAALGNYYIVHDSNMLHAVSKSNLSVLYSVSLDGAPFSIGNVPLDMANRGPQVKVASDNGHIYVCNKDTLQEFGFSSAIVPASAAFYTKSEVDAMLLNYCTKTTCADFANQLQNNYCTMAQSIECNEFKALKEEVLLNRVSKDQFNKIVGKILKLEETLKEKQE